MEFRRIFLSPPHMSGRELELVREAFDSNYIAPSGPQLELFEREFEKKTGICFALAVSSGTAAMHLALRVLGVGIGDTVLASTLTFIGSVTPIVFLGAMPVFVDSSPDSWTMDPELLNDELLNCAKHGILPKAVVPTDLYGQCADLDRILEICEPYGIPVIDDAAEALGSLYRGRSAGAGAKAAVFSFNGNKIITTSGGGMLASDDKEFIDHARKLSQQAREPYAHYEHMEIGYNYRMSNILAAIGCGQLKILEDRIAAKRRIYKYYRRALQRIEGIDFMPLVPWVESNHWLTVILVSPQEFGADREKIRLALDAENIESRPVWKPMHLQPVFDCQSDPQLCKKSGSGDTRIEKNPKNRYRARVLGGSVAENLFEKGLCLPSGTALTEDDLNRVVSIILDCRRG